MIIWNYPFSINHTNLTYILFVYNQRSMRSQYALDFLFFHLDSGN